MTDSTSTDPTVPPVQEYPKLMWSATGQEITVNSKGEEDAKAGEGYSTEKPDHDLPGGPRGPRPSHPISDPDRPEVNPKPDRPEPKRR